MNLYALKDKNTGKWLEGPPTQTRVTAYEDRAECEAVKEYFADNDPIVVTLREEPVEPCWECTSKNTHYKTTTERGTPLVAERNFCPECGRRLR